MIPKIIHYCWFGGKPLTELAQRCIASWKKFCPDYEIIRWDESNMDISSIAYMKEAYEEKAWAFVSDVARLQAVMKYGGIYLDTDVELIKPLDDLLSNNAFAAIEENDRYFVALGLGFGAQKGSEFVKALLESYEGRHFRQEDGTSDRTAAPLYQSGLMQSMGFNGKNENQQVADALIYSSEYFCPKSQRTGVLKITDRSYSIHHYNGSWKTREEISYIKCKHKILQNFGSFPGNIIWTFYRVIYKLKKTGVRNTMRLISKKIKNIR
ncbi:MAG: glycosyl transferase [Ruminococcus sp.]|nr:glycosyl transferase [Ruminococcus sp.]